MKTSSQTTHSRRYSIIGKNATSYLFTSFFLFFAAKGISQEFNTTSSLPLNINAATLNPNPGCNSNRSISFNVSGVGIISPDNQLLEIKIDALTSNNDYPRLAFNVYIQAPDGTCFQIASKMGDVSKYSAKDKALSYSFRAPNDCLNKEPDFTGAANHNFQSGQSGNAGVFATVDDISTVLNGKNADGTWKIYFGRTYYLYENIPTIQGASIIFGEPLPVTPPNENLGKSCVGAYDWQGGPVCLTTKGKTTTSFTPGNSSCEWYGTLENTLWIKFTPTESKVCINASGIKEGSYEAYGLQSVVVKPTNPSDPCTSSNNWTVMSCPRNSGIYPSHVGISMNQNHCFTATPGEEYYLVVDGNKGAESDIYLTGIEGLSIILPVEILSFTAECKSNGNIDFNWSTASETNNDFFTIQNSSDGVNWTDIAKIKGSGSTSSKTEYNHIDRDAYSEEINYFRLKQTDYDGTVKTLSTVSLINCNKSSKVSVVPNPNSGDFKIITKETGIIETIQIFNITGRLSAQIDNSSKSNQFNFSLKEKGSYFMQVIYKDGSVDFERIIVQ